MWWHGDDSESEWSPPATLTPEEIEAKRLAFSAVYAKARAEWSAFWADLDVKLASGWSYLDLTRKMRWLQSGPRYRRNYDLWIASSRIAQIGEWQGVPLFNWSSMTGFPTKTWLTGGLIVADRSGQLYKTGQFEGQCERLPGPQEDPLTPSKYGDFLPYHGSPILTSPDGGVFESWSKGGTEWVKLGVCEISQ